MYYRVDISNSKLYQIQKIQLECLNEVKRICNNSELNYCLAYGTMLGAIRHKGFIPWDDDLDIYMPIKDVFDLGKYINQKEFFLQTEKTDPEMPFVFYKIRKNGTKMIEEKFKDINIHHGIWIDIFPYTNAAKTRFGKRVQFFLDCMIQSLRTRAYNKSVNRKVHFRHTPDRVINILDSAFLKMLILVGKNNSKEYYVLCNEPFNRTFIDKSFLDNTIDVLFEGDTYKGVSDYHNYLVKEYGYDYMTPKKYTHINNYDNVVI